MRLLIGVFIILMTGSHKLMAQVSEAAPIALTGSVDYQSQIGRVLGVLLLILLLIFAVVWLMKKIGYTGHSISGSMSIKACLPLSNKDKLYIVQVGEEQLLIGLSANGINALKTLEKPLEETQSHNNVISSNFSKKLNEFMLAKKIVRTNVNAKEANAL